MREIKFRARHKEGAYMMPVEEIDFENKLINKSGAWRWFNEIVIMQYTGLKDKNGVEIYEGDLIQVEGMFPNEPFKVWYRNGMYHIGNWNLQGFMNAFDFYEVIGNIYENNDLLEGSE